MRKLAEEGMTMLVVTHEMNFARNVSNKVIFMMDGEIIETKTAKDFFNNPEQACIKTFLRTYLNSDEGSQSYELRRVNEEV